jgi:hypothetical protein
VAVERLTIDGKTLLLTLHRESLDRWHWMVAAPGELLLSGTAADAIDAAADARRCALAWADQRTAKMLDGTCGHARGPANSVDSSPVRHAR